MNKSYIYFLFVNLDFVYSSFIKNKNLPFLQIS